MGTTKAFHKISCPLLKTLNKLGIERNLHSLIMNIGKPTTGLILKWRRTEYFPSKHRNKTKMSVFIISTLYWRFLLEQLDGKIKGI